MQHPEEGTIHAWIDGALDADSAREVETHIASCAECTQLAAEARGLVAASSRILTALDDVPGDVIPSSRAAAQVPYRVAIRSWVTPFWMRTAAAVVIVAGVSALVMTGKLNSPERKRTDLGTFPVPAELQRAAVAQDAVSKAPSALEAPASAPPSVTRPSATSMGAAASQTLSARAERSASIQQEVPSAPVSKDSPTAVLAKERALSDKAPREERVAEADQSRVEKSARKTNAVDAAAPTPAAPRREVAGNSAVDVRGVLSGAQASSGRMATGIAQGGQGAAVPSASKPAAQSMAPQSATQQDFMSRSGVRTAAGCYALTLSPWSGGTIPFGAPPPRIELDSLTSVQESIRGLNLVHPARGAASNGVPLAYWRMFGDSVYVTWRDDVHGVTLTLPLSGEVTQGSARTFSTSARDGAAQTTDVEARRISCRE